MYDVIFGHGRSWSVIRQNLPSLKKAKEARVLIGDVVVYSGTAKVVRSEDWLDEWEKQDKGCYAQRRIKEGCLED